MLGLLGVVIGSPEHIAKVLRRDGQRLRVGAGTFELERDINN
jgi:hypothetical protein